MVAGETFYRLSRSAHKNIRLFLNGLLILILYLRSKIDLWAYFYFGYYSVSEYLFR